MNLFFLYRLEHIDACMRFLNEHPQVREEGYLIIASGVELERALIKRGIPFHSGRAYRPVDRVRFQQAEKWTTEILESSNWKWFEYRGVALTQTFYLAFVYCNIQN